MTRHQEETTHAGVSLIESNEAEMLEEEEDVGVLRLMRLQAAMKEKHIVESEG